MTAEVNNASLLGQEGTSRRVVTSGLAVLTAKCLGKLVSFVLAAYLVRYLGPSGAGEYTLVFTYLGLVSVVANQGIGNVMVRHLSREEPRPGALIGSALILRLASAFVAVGVAVALVFVLPYPADTRFLVIVGLPVLFLALDSDSFISTCARLFQVGARLLVPASLEMFTAVLMAASALILVQMKASLAAFVVVQSLIGAPAGVLLLYRLRRDFPVALGFDRELLTSVLRESLPIGLAGALAMLYSQVDVVLLSLMAPDPHASIGYYAAAFRTTRALSVVPIAIQVSFFSVLCAEYACSRAAFRKTWESTQRYMLALGAPLVALLLGAAEPIVHVMFGEGFAPSVLALQLLAPSVAFIWVNYLAFAALVAMDRQRTLFFVAGGMLAFNLLGNLIAIPLFGLYGPSAMTTLTEGLGAVISIWMASKDLGGYSAWPLAKLGVASAVMIVPLVAFSHQVVLAVVVSLVVYAGAVVILGAITRDDLQIVVRSVTTR